MSFVDQDAGDVISLFLTHSYCEVASLKRELTGGILNFVTNPADAWALKCYYSAIYKVIFKF